MDAPGGGKRDGLWCPKKEGLDVDGVTYNGGSWGYCTELAGPKINGCQPHFEKVLNFPSFGR